jgi:hypothetical protein
MPGTGHRAVPWATRPTALPAIAPIARRAAGGVHPLCRGISGDSAQQVGEGGRRRHALQPSLPLSASTVCSRRLGFPTPMPATSISERHGVPRRPRALERRPRVQPVQPSAHVRVSCKDQACLRPGGWYPYGPVI